VSSNIFTFSNFLSLLRILLIAPFIYYLEVDERLLAFIIMIFAISTDWFDGQVARWTNTVSDIGKILDPLADKLCALASAGYFFWKGELPVWFVIIVVFRDIAIFFGGIYLKHKYHVLTTALPTGKWAVGFLALIFIAMVWPIQSEITLIIKNVFLTLSTILLVISFAQYLLRMIYIIQGKPYKNL